MSFKIINLWRQKNLLVRAYADRASIKLFIFWAVLVIEKILRINFASSGVTPERRIDVVIPVGPNDNDTLPHLIASLSKVQQIVEKIYIVSRDDPKIRGVCAELNLEFVDETSVLGFDKSKCAYQVGGIDRSGWLFQQLLKLSCDQISLSEYILVVDADTVFISPISFFSRGRYVFYKSLEWNQNYFDAFEYLFKRKPNAKYSLTSHMMIFNRKYLAAMREDIERKHGVRWHDAYLETRNSLHPSCVSDYECYGNWVRLNLPSACALMPLYNKSIARIKMEEALHNTDLPRKFHSLSFHHYIN